MELTDDAATRPPSVILINGREYVLYQGFTERLRIANAKSLWVHTVSTWLLAVFAGLTTINGFRPDSSLWFSAAGLVAVGCSAALANSLDNQDLFIRPLVVSTRKWDGGAPALAITSEPQSVFSKRTIVVQFATVHPEMADFLLAAFDEGKTPGFRQRPRIPSTLITPRARRQAWLSNAGLVVTLGMLVSVVVAIATR